MTLLAELQARGVTLEADGDQLRYKAPPGALTDELRAAMRAHKADLLAEMAADDGPTGAAIAPVGITDLANLIPGLRAWMAAPHERRDVPAEPCGWFKTHRRFWQRPKVGGWVCGTCYPPVEPDKVTWHTVGELTR